MAFNVSYIVEAIDKFTAVSSRITDAAAKMQDKFDTLRLKTMYASDHMRKFGEASRAMGSNLESMGGQLTARLTAPIAAVGIMSLRSAAQMESMQVALEVMTGSAQKAKFLTDQLLTFAAETPFQVAEVSAVQNALISAGVEVDDVKKKLTMLGDIASGTVTKDLMGIAVILTDIKSKGAMDTADIRQFSTRGIALRQTIMKGIGLDPEKDGAKFQKMVESKLITYDIVVKAMEKMTGEGGMYNKMMEKQSKTLSGLFSSTLDYIQQTLGAIGLAVSNSVGLKDVLESVNRVLLKVKNSVQEFTTMHPLLTKYIVIFLGILAVIGPLMIALGALATVMGFLAGGIALLMSPIFLTIAGLIALGAAAVYLFNKFQPVQEIFYGIVGTVMTLIDAIGWLMFKLTQLMALDIKGFFGDVPEKIGGMIKHLFSSEDSEGGVAAQQGNRDGTLNGTITVRDTSGVVKSVESSAFGNVGNLGLNMGGISR